MKKNKTNKKERGITLIALVITVIIMLILAGVAISVLTSDGGLFEKTQGAADKYQQAAQNEADQITSLMNDIDKYLNGLPSLPQEPDKPIATVVKVGDYVNYDAGTWTVEDFNKITSSAGSPTVNKSASLPTTQGQFGGFTEGQSRNTNSTEYSSSYVPKYSGWRVWSIEGNTVTLISAGHPETYYHALGNSVASVEILRNRNCSMYENSYAQVGSAHILTGQEAASWYNNQFGTNYTIIENGTHTSTFYDKTFTEEEPISVLENGSHYWLASAWSTAHLYYVYPHLRYVNSGSNYGSGVRVLVSLKSDVLLEQGTGDGSVGNPWKIVQK